MERESEYDPKDPSYGEADADKAPPEGENASGPLGEVSTEEDTSGGPATGGGAPSAGDDESDSG